MSRDDFSEKTKRNLAQRSGGRCSYPGCDHLCWLPGSEPNKSYTLGVAAHICAASPLGPRFDPMQTPEKRTSIDNAIFLCQNHARQIDADKNKYTKDLLIEYKKKHEAQILGQAEGKWLLPDISINKSIGLTFSSEEPRTISNQSLQNRVEHEITIQNNTDYEYIRIGFYIQYPEYVEHKPIITGPPGISYNINGENMEYQIAASGGGSVNSPKVTHYASFNFESNNLIPRQSIRLLIKSISSDRLHWKASEKFKFWISGSLTAKIGNIFEEYFFTLPIFYDTENRLISNGYPHVTDRESDNYILISRS